jgi:hypothetical protein
LGGDPVGRNPAVTQARVGSVYVLDGDPISLHRDLCSCGSRYALM